MLPDTRSLAFLTILTCTVSMMVMVLLWRQSRHKYRGMGWLVADTGCQIAGILLIAQRDRIPDWVSIVLANMLVFGGSVMGYRGLAQFLDRQVHLLHLWVLGAVYTAVFAWFGVVHTDLPSRNLVFSLGLGVIWGQCAWLLLVVQPPESRGMTRGVGLVFVGYCLVNVARLGEILLDPHPATDYMQAGTFERLVLTAYQLLFIALTFTVTLMVNRRLLADVAIQEAKFTKAFRAAPYALALTRAADGNVVEVNDGFVKLSGYAPHQLMGRTSLELHLWTDPADRAAVLEEIARTGRSGPHKFSFTRGTGQALTGVFTAESMVLNGELHVLSSINDITKLEEAEVAVRASEERHRTLLASLGDAVIATDAEGRVDLMNPVAEALTGWSSAEAQGRPIDEVFNIINEDSLCRVESPVARVIAEGRVVGLANHTLLLSRDGTSCPIADSGAPIRDGRGAIVGVVLVFRNQSQERAAQKALEQAVAQHQGALSIINQSPAVVFLRRAEMGWPVEYVTENVRQFGYEPQDFLSRRLRFADIIHSVDQERVCRDIEQKLAEPGVVEFRLHYRIRSAAGEEVWVDDRTFVRRDDQGGLTHLQGIVLDVTELQRERHEREHLQASLAQSDRLANMGLLAAGLAHEINNPLTFVLHNMESLAVDIPKLLVKSRTMRPVAGDGPPPDNAAVVEQAQEENALELLKEALDGAQRIRRIVQGVGSFARVESADVAPISLKTSMEHALGMAANEIRFRARVVKDLLDVPPVIASEGKLAQVFLNLLINAVHSIEEGNVEGNEIRVGTWVEEGRVCAAVTDTGHGIAPEHRDRLFEPFYSTKRMGQGSGLGLWISQNIIRGFGGEMTFDSEVGKGTRFVVRMPAAPSAEPPPTSPPAQTEASTEGVRGRILVVDDEAGIRRMFVRAAGKQHDVVTAASGEEARALLEKDRQFDVIFSDLMMPDMSGVELHGWLAQQDPIMAARVVFITGGTFTDGASEYLARVGNLHLDKPFQPGELPRLMQRLVEQARSQKR